MCKETKAIFKQRMDDWEAGYTVTLVRSLEEHASCGLRMRPVVDKLETELMPRRFAAMVKNGKLWLAVRTMTERERGKLLHPIDQCKKQYKQ